MQTILGAGGAIGIELAKALSQYTNEICLVSRNPAKVNAGDRLIAADLLKPAEVMRATAGAEIVYLTAGFAYNIKVWQTTWPVVMRNVIDACKVHKAKLVFFDNIYMYDPDYLDPMTEETPVNPKSKKGEVRAKIVKMIMDEVKSGTLQALIARSADFYGPGLKTSMLTETVFKNLAQGKKAFWLGDATCKHSFTYTPDAGKGTALLGNTPDAYNQVWHLPTASSPMTGQGWIEAIAREMNVAPRYQPVPKFMVRMMGLFVPIMREMVEMIYQYDRNYVFDSTKFEKRFGLNPTPYLVGIKKIVEIDYKTAGLVLKA